MHDVTARDDSNRIRLDRYRDELDRPRVRSQRRRQPGTGGKIGEEWFQQRRCVKGIEESIQRAAIFRHGTSSYLEENATSNVPARE